MAEFCKHFGECGGCQNQDLPYPEQLARKAQRLAEQFRAHWDAPVPVEPSPETWHYRNKVDFSFGRKWYPEPPPEGFVREAVLGFRARGRWFCPLDIEECRIGPEGVSALLGSVRAWMHARKLPAFDPRTKEGFLRALVVREGKRTRQRMVVLITTEGDLDKDSFVEVVLSVYPATSIQCGVYQGLADVAFADETEVLHGGPAIHEQLEVPDGRGERVLRFRLSPFSFFQTNTLGAERLYGMIRRWVAEAAPLVLYDLYGGGGGIALSCADLVAQVWSVESVAAATEDGRHNTAQNGADNVEFVTQRVKNYLRALREGDGMAADSAVVVDPPRSGMVPKALRRLVDLRPPKVLYVSCNPAILATQLPVLLGAYRLDDLRAIDLFPHTEHVEALASFSLR